MKNGLNKKIFVAFFIYFCEEGSSYPVCLSHCGDGVAGSGTRASTPKDRE